MQNLTKNTKYNCQPSAHHTFEFPLLCSTFEGNHTSHVLVTSTSEEGEGITLLVHVYLCQYAYRGGESLQIRVFQFILCLFEYLSDKSPSDVLIQRVQRELYGFSISLITS